MQVCNETLTRLHIPALSRSLLFEGCPGLADSFSAILRGWNLSQGEHEAAAIGTVRRNTDKYSWLSQATPAPEGWAFDPPRTEMEALCDLHFELIDWYLDAYPDHLCVHCAAAEFASGLVVFPSPTKAGKSTLTLQLAATGHRIFCDDILPVEPGRDDGLALGILPRIRLPLPRALGRALGPFLAHRSGPSDLHYQYVKLARDELAPLGTVAPVAGLVLLERKDAGPARIEPVSHGEMLKLIIARNFAGIVPAPDIFERLHALTGRVPRFRLAYSQGHDAIDLLEQEFGAGGVREGMQ